MIVWENGHGQKRYQPVRCDGASLSIDCGLSGCLTYWRENASLTPKVYRWRWRARQRERIGSWFYRRADLKRIHPVV